MSTFPYKTTPDGLLEALANAYKVGLDIETTGLSPFDSKVRLLSLAVEGHGIWVIDLFKYPPSPKLWVALQLPVLIGHNIKFDLKFLRYHYDFLPWSDKVWDTFRLSYMIHNGKEDMKHDLYSIRERELHIPPGEDFATSDWSAPELSKEQLDYAAEDVYHLILLNRKLRQYAVSLGMQDAVSNEMGAIVPEVEMELNGFHLDRSKWSKIEKENIAQESLLREELWKELPSKQIMLPGISGGVNLESPDEVRQALCSMGIEVAATNKITLAQIAHKYPVVQKFMKWRKANKAISSFGSDFLQHIQPKTGRIHPSYWPLTGAGRYSCSGPNLQQIPADKRYRSCFTAPEGRKLVIADYSQIELRIAASVSRDETLMGVYKNKLDAHTKTASIIAGNIALADVTPEQRQLAKPVNFGLIYGMGPEKLALYSMVNYGIPMTIEQAGLFHSRYFEAYRGIRDWQRFELKQGRRDKRSHTLDGRIRYLNPDECYSEFFNTPVQGTGAGGLKRAMAIVHNRLPHSAKIVNVVHDEIVVECAEEEAEDVASYLDVGMVEAMQEMVRNVPIAVETGIGDSWADK